MVSDTNTFVNSYNYTHYSELYEENVTSASVYIKTANSISGDNIKLSERLFIPSKRLRGFEKGKVGPLDGSDHIGGNYTATLNFDANLPNFLPEDTKTDINLFLDFGNVWGVDYDSSLDDSNKIRSSTGLAANWISPLGPMSFVFSQNLSKADTDKTEFFNFNLGTTF